MRNIYAYIACLGVAAAWFGEVVTGLGPITQLSYETGVSSKFAYGITLSLVAWQLFLGISPFSPTWNPKNQIDVDRRKKGITGITAFEPDVNRRIKPTEEPGKFFLRNELVLGRSAITSRNGPFLPNYFTVGKSYYPINFTLFWVKSEDLWVILHILGNNLGKILTKITQFFLPKSQKWVKDWVKARVINGLGV